MTVNVSLFKSKGLNNERRQADILAKCYSMVHRRVHTLSPMTPYAHHPGGFVVYAADTGPDTGRIYAMLPGAEVWQDWHAMIAKYGLNPDDFTLYGYLPENPAHE